MADRNIIIACLIIVLIILIVAFFAIKRGYRETMKTGGQDVWDLTENTGQCKSQIRGHCIGLPFDTQKWFGYKNLDDCVNDPRQIPEQCQPNNKRIFCKYYVPLNVQSSFPTYYGPNAFDQCINTRGLLYYIQYKEKNFNCLRKSKSWTEYEHKCRGLPLDLST